MSNDATQVLSGRPSVSGAVFRLPAGTSLTSLDTDPFANLPAGAVALGYVSEDGLTNSYTRDSEVVREWGGRIVRVLQTDVTDTWALTFLQSGDVNVLKAVFGDAQVTEDATSHVIKVVRNGEPLEAAIWVFEMFDAGRKRRVILGNAQITESEDIAYVRGTPVQYGVTITAYPDEAGASSTEYLEGSDPA